MKKITTQETIDFMNKQQERGSYHPYTCCSPSDIKECKRQLSYNKRQNGEIIEYNKDNEGILTATLEGWICPCGKYKQEFSKQWNI